MKSRPGLPIASSTGMPNSRSAARFAQRISASGSTTSTASGSAAATRGHAGDIGRRARALLTHPRCGHRDFIDPRWLPIEGIASDAPTRDPGRERAVPLRLRHPVQVPVEDRL